MVSKLPASTRLRRQAQAGAWRWHLRAGPSARPHVAVFPWSAGTWGAALLWWKAASSPDRLKLTSTWSLPLALGRPGAHAMVSTAQGSCGPSKAGSSEAHSCRLGFWETGSWDTCLGVGQTPCYRPGAQAPPHHETQAPEILRDADPVAGAHAEPRAGAQGPGDT